MQRSEVQVHGADLFSVIITVLYVQYAIKRLVPGLYLGGWMGNDRQLQERRRICM